MPLATLKTQPLGEVGCYPRHSKKAKIITLILSKRDSKEASHVSAANHKKLIVLIKLIETCGNQNRVRTPLTNIFYKSVSRWKDV